MGINIKTNIYVGQLCDEFFLEREACPKYFLVKSGKLFYDKSILFENFVVCNTMWKNVVYINTEQDYVMQHRRFVFC